MAQDQDGATEVVPTRYRVCGPRVTVTTQVDPDQPGRADRDFLRGEVLPQDVPAEQIQRLLGAFEVEVIDNRSDAGANVADGQSQTVDGRTGELLDLADLIEEGLDPSEAAARLRQAATSHGEPEPTGTGQGAAVALPGGDATPTAEERIPGAPDAAGAGPAADEDGWVVGESDPADFNGDVVSKRLAAADDAERDRILAAERAGKARKGVLGE